MTLISLKLSAVLVAGIAIVSAVAATSAVQAQDRFEANTQGYRGGYSTNGGYYDTFGGYGGTGSYGNYNRTPGNYSPTTSFFSIPLTAPPTSGAEPCSYLRRRAQETGARKWKARYVACRNGG